MIIEVNNVMSRIYNATEWFNELDEFLSVFHPQYKRSTKYKQGLWDGKTHFFKVKTGKFPTGMLFKIREFCNKNNIELVTKDLRIKPTINDGMLERIGLNGITLRDYQLEAVLESIKKQRGILRLPTGSGKTEVAIAIVKALNLKTLYLVHTKDLLHQTAERFKKRIPEIDVGKIGDGICTIGNDITIAMVQSLNNIKEKDIIFFKDIMKYSQVLIIDECHHTSAKIWHTIAMYAHYSFFRFGLSGTPLHRTTVDNLKLNGAVGDIIYELPTIELIKRGDLCPIDLKILEINYMSYEQKWQKIYKDAIVRCEERNDKIIEIAKTHFNKGENVMILVREIEHGNILIEKLTENNIANVYLQGTTKSEIREIEKQKFNSPNKNFVLVATTIFDEGVDLPEVNVLILAAGGKSQVKTIQRIGRGLRKKTDGSSLSAYDFYDNSKYLYEHSDERVAIYKHEGLLKGDQT